jgi:acylphosphatase/predicted  nucleic acid-binding Zn-ribbon protein
VDRVYAGDHTPTEADRGAGEGARGDPGGDWGIRGREGERGLNARGIIALRLTLKGRVQRVGLRRYALDLAQELGLKGYAKNLPDGSLEVLAQGLEEPIRAFIGALRSPPPPAHVRELTEELVEPSPEIREFRVIYGDYAEELQEGFGAMQAIFTDYWREFRDYRQEFKDYRKEFEDYRQEFRDFRQDFEDYRQEFKDYRKEFEDYRQEFRDFRQDFEDYRQEFKDYRKEFEDYRQEFKDFRQDFEDYRQEFKDYRKEFREFADRTDENFRILFERYGEISEKLTVILETLVRESKETREQLAKAMDRLAAAIEALKGPPSPEKN